MREEGRKLGRGLGKRRKSGRNGGGGDKGKGREER
jgi:hypothetical protein